MLLAYLLLFQLTIRGLTCLSLHQLNRRLSKGLTTYQGFIPPLKIHTHRKLFIKAADLPQTLGFSKNSAAAPYFNSDHYKRVSEVFTREQQEFDAEKFGSIKDHFVYRVEGSDEFMPSRYDLEALAVVPELFHANFSKRDENHWSKLLEIRRLFLDKSDALEARKVLENTRSQLAGQYHSLSSEEADEIRVQGLKTKDDLSKLQEKIKHLSLSLKNLLYSLPNILSEAVGPEPLVLGEYLTADSKSDCIPHYEAINRFCGDLMNKAIDTSGTGFYALSGELAKLERALGNFMLDTHSQLFGYTEVSVPLIVGSSVLESTGNLPRFHEDLFKLHGRHLCNEETSFLIPTAEVSLLGLHRNSRVDLDSLPKWQCAKTPCFRSEIQNYGRDTRGLLRQHQFQKVELMCFCNANNSEYYHNLMVGHIEHILKLLRLPFRRVLLSAKDTGSASSKTVDFEVFMPSMNKFLEVSSCSNTRDYQSSRLNLKDIHKKKVHCINGSGLAIGRTLSALLENHQTLTSDGRILIKIPDALQPYFKGSEIEEPLAE